MLLFKPIPITELIDSIRLASVIVQIKTDPALA